MSNKQQFKVVEQLGGGPPPGAVWRPIVLDVAYREAKRVLSGPQYDHMALQVKDLATHDEPTRSETLSLDDIDDYHELRDWGGALGSVSVRVFYGVDKESRCIVILGTILKKNNGPTPIGVKVRMHRRWRRYQSGDFGRL